MFSTAPQPLTDSEASRNPPASILFGRYMLPDMTEHPCQVTHIDGHSAVFVTASVPPAGTRMVAYIDEIGRVEASASEPVPGGFKVRFLLNQMRRERLEQRLKWLAEKGEGSPDQRRHTRYEPKDSKSHITMADGRVYSCEVLDISLSGAAVKIEVMPAMGTFLLLGKMRGRVVRYLPEGFAVEFTRQLERKALADEIAR
jgi:hypothetical protein